ncbi:unnamed protein product, partial [Iphiclides podalirius]
MRGGRCPDTLSIDEAFAHQWDENGSECPLTYQLIIHHKRTHVHFDSTSALIRKTMCTSPVPDGTRQLIAAKQNAVRFQAHFTAFELDSERAQRYATALWIVCSA